MPNRRLEGVIEPRYGLPKGGNLRLERFRADVLAQRRELLRGVKSIDHSNDRLIASGYLTGRWGDRDSDGAMFCLSSRRRCCPSGV